MVIYLLLLYFVSCSVTMGERSFVVDYDNDQFLKDGKPFRYVSGSLHYFRTPRALWRDRMERSRAMGINAIQTYIQWSTHEMFQNSYNFDKDANITEYLEMANNLSLLVILRIGPYIDSAVDFGGFPYWLLKYSNIKPQTFADLRYRLAVDKWFSMLLPKIRPMLYCNGGPVIMIQAENEYGSFGCDHIYTSWLLNTTKKYLQDPVVYFTTDGPSEVMLSCGQVPETLTTVDFGPTSESSVKQNFDLLRKFMPKGPKVNSEFYPGWFDVWGQPKRSTTPSLAVTNTVKYMWKQNASFNIFLVHGGTSWGYQGGSFNPPFRPVTTEFDNDAPVAENGDIMPKFLDMRSTIEEITGIQVPYPVPKNATKYNYGDVSAQYLGNIFDLLATISPTETWRKSQYPLAMEYLDWPYGFVLYETVIPQNGTTILINEIRDRVYIIVNYQLIKAVQRDAKDKPTGVNGNFVIGSIIHILVENQGRICYGHDMVDRKGLISNVTLDGETLINWTMYPLRLKNIYSLSYRKLSRLISKRLKEKVSKFKFGANYLPSFYLSYVMVDNIGDTYFNSTAWGKGQLFVNGINIGRYYATAGPQMSLYVPACYLNNFNQIITFELDHPGNCDSLFTCHYNLVENPIYT